MRQPSAAAPPTTVTRAGGAAGDTQPTVGRNRRERSARLLESYPLVRFIVRRIVLMVPTAFVASLLTFSLIKLIPGGPVWAMLGTDPNPDAIAYIKAQLGLDLPVHMQYLTWLGRALQGDLGLSFESSQPVATIVRTTLPVSLQLVGLALLLTVAWAVPTGVAIARRAGSRTDGAVRSVSGIGLALPDFFVAIVFAAIFAVWLGVLPRLGYPRFAEDPLGNLYHIILPTLPLALGAGGIVVRQVRAAMIDALNSDYVRTARAMGLKESAVIWRYAFRGALPTVLNVYGLLAIGILGATVIIERIFVLPGMGNTLISAIAFLDYTVILGIMLIYVVIALVVNLVVDVAVGIVSPRSREK